MIKKKKTYKELEDEINELRKRNEDLSKSSNYNYKNAIRYLELLNDLCNKISEIGERKFGNIYMDTGSNLDYAYLILRTINAHLKDRK